MKRHWRLSRPSPRAPRLRAAVAAPRPETKPGVESETESELARSRRRNWAKLISKVSLCDPERCPGGGMPRKIVAAISSPTQDEVIEKILETPETLALRSHAPREPTGPGLEADRFAVPGFSGLFAAPSSVASQPP